jgi:hypothetical protein
VGVRRCCADARYAKRRQTSIHDLYKAHSDPKPGDVRPEFA